MFLSSYDISGVQEEADDGFMTEECCLQLHLSRHHHPFNVYENNHKATVKHFNSDEFYYIHNAAIHSTSTATQLFRFAPISYKHFKRKVMATLHILYLTAMLFMKKYSNSPKRQLNSDTDQYSFNRSSSSSITDILSEWSKCNDENFEIFHETDAQTDDNNTQVSSSFIKNHTIYLYSSPFFLRKFRPLDRLIMPLTLSTRKTTTTILSNHRRCLAYYYLIPIILCLFIRNSESCTRRLSLKNRNDTITPVESALITEKLFERPDYSYNTAIIWTTELPNFIQKFFTQRVSTSPSDKDVDHSTRYYTAANYSNLMIGTNTPTTAIQHGVKVNKSRASYPPPPLSNYEYFVKCDNETADNLHPCGPRGYCDKGSCQCHEPYHGPGCTFHFLQVGTKSTILTASVSSGVIVCLLAILSIVFGLYLIFQQRKQSNYHSKLMDPTNKIRLLLDTLYDSNGNYNNNNNSTTTLSASVHLLPDSNRRILPYGGHRGQDNENIHHPPPNLYDWNPILRTLEGIKSDHDHTTLTSTTSTTHVNKEYHELEQSLSSTTRNWKSQISKSPSSPQQLPPFIKPYMYFDFTKVGDKPAPPPPRPDTKISSSSKVGVAEFHHLQNTELDDMYSRYFPHSADASLLAQTPTPSTSYLNAKKKPATENTTLRPFNASIEDILSCISVIQYGSRDTTTTTATATTLSSKPKD